jgi:hypothetical protein
VPKLRFPEFGEGFHAKARSREVEEEGCNEFQIKIPSRLRVFA